MVELESGSALYRGKSTAEWYIDKGSKKYKKEEG